VEQAVPVAQKVVQVQVQVVEETQAETQFLVDQVEMGFQVAVVRYQMLAVQYYKLVVQVEMV
jgi:hypothetical protein